MIDKNLPSFPFLPFTQNQSKNYRRKLVMRIKETFELSEKEQTNSENI